jgi:phosphotransferase system  glucose/maltose/N-acetylglucosamine-specific IIC component
MLVMIPLSLCVLSPLGSFLGTYISNFIIWLYNTIGFVGVAVFSGLCPLLVMTGMHSSMMPYLLNSFATLGWEPIVLTGMIISNIDQGAACLAVALKTKNADRKSTAVGCGITAVVGGVTEPGMYGINLPLKTPLYCAMAGSAIGAAVAGLGKAVAYAITGSAGILGGVPVYLPGGTSNVVWMCAGIAIGFVVTFVSTLVLYKDPAEN